MLHHHSPCAVFVIRRGVAFYQLSIDTPLTGKCRLILPGSGFVAIQQAAAKPVIILMSTIQSGVEESTETKFDRIQLFASIVNSFAYSLVVAVIFQTMSVEKKSKVPENMSVGFIGAGRMAQAMARGFISTGAYSINIFF